MPLYRVTWLIDIHADTAKDAAILAREVQTWSDNTACVFRVSSNADGNGELVSVAVDDEQASNYRCYIAPLKAANE